MIGQVLHDTYRIERQLGAGGMAAVFEASHLRLPRRFAVKILLESVAKDRDALARFAREAKVTGSLGHANIVEVVDFHFPSDGQPYLVMELLRGEDLAARLLKPPRLTLDEIDLYICQVASALDVTHKRGIIHRDLKPSNLFICNASLIKVLDFGMSKVLRSNTCLTGVETIIGTPFYMPPEQVQGEATIDERTDIYAMGAILFEMLAGQPPFTGSNVFDVLGQVLRHPPPPLSRLRPGLPPEIDAVLLRALSKSPDERPASAGELARDFARAAGTAGPRRRLGLVALSDPLPPSQEITIPPALRAEELAGKTQRPLVAASAPNAVNAADARTPVQVRRVEVPSDEPKTKTLPVALTSAELELIADPEQRVPVEVKRREEVPSGEAETTALPQVSLTSRELELTAEPKPSVPAELPSPKNITPTLDMVHPLPAAPRPRDRRVMLLRAIVVLFVVGIGLSIGMFIGLRNTDDLIASPPAVVEVDRTAKTQTLDRSKDLGTATPLDLQTVVNLRTKKVKRRRSVRRARRPAAKPRVKRSAPKAKKSPSPKSGTLGIIVKVNGKLQVMPIKVDGERMSSPVGRLELTLGVHHLQVDHQDYLPIEKMVTVTNRHKKVILVTKRRR